MDHWSEKYLGRPYDVKTFNCAHLAVLVRKEVFGHDIALPTDIATSALSRTQQIAGNKEDYATPTLEPTDGDAVLIVARGRLQHIGVLCLINGERWVLHNIQGKGAAAGYQGEVVRHLERDLHKIGWSVEGYYKWI